MHCEIDEGVIDAAKTFFPSLSSAFEDKRLEQVIGDAVDYVDKAAANTFDVIIVDSSDPVGPAEKLFSKEFYANVHRILKPDGVLCSQGECLWVNADLIEEMIKEHGAPFASAEYANIQTPTYPSGQIGAFLARKSSDGTASSSCRGPRRAIPEDMVEKLKYYTGAMHTAAFALPAFLERRLSQASDAAKKRRLLESA